MLQKVKKGRTPKAWKELLKLKKIPRKNLKDLKQILIKKQDENTLKIKFKNMQQREKNQNYMKCFKHLE